MPDLLRSLPKRYNLGKWRIPIIIIGTTTKLGKSEKGTEILLSGDELQHPSRLWHAIVTGRWAGISQYDKNHKISLVKVTIKICERLQRDKEVLARKQHHDGPMNHVP